MKHFSTAALLTPPPNPQTPTAQSQKTQNGHNLEKVKICKISPAQEVGPEPRQVRCAEKMEPLCSSLQHHYSSSSSSSASPAPCCLGGLACWTREHKWSRKEEVKKQLSSFRAREMSNFYGNLIHCPPHLTPRTIPVPPIYESSLSITGWIPNYLCSSVSVVGGCGGDPWVPATFTPTTEREGLETSS